MITWLAESAKHAALTFHGHEMQDGGMPEKSALRGFAAFEVDKHQVELAMHPSQQPVTGKAKKN
jgi:hypothetical protein